MAHDNVLIVLNYNDAKTTSSFIACAEKCSSIAQIVIVDNCSTDDSFARLCQLASDRVDIIRTDKNGGYAYGNHFGVQYAVQRYDPSILFLANPDVRFDDITVSRMIRCLKEHPNAAIAAPLVNQGYNVWDLPNYVGVIESCFLLWHNIHKKIARARVLASENEIVPVGVVEGSFFAIKADAYKRIHGFDQRTFLYYEENILARRIKDAHLDIVVLKNCRYDHFHSMTIKKTYKTKANAFKLFYPSMLLYLTSYLHINTFQKELFSAAFQLAYFERHLYDLIVNCKNHNKTSRGTADRK